MASGQGPNSQKQTSSLFEGFFKNLRKVKMMNLLPCIVFFFSRAKVEDLAEEIDAQMNFIEDSERKRIKEFKKRAL
jgi:superfamily II RNA helicase